MSRKYVQLRFKQQTARQQERTIYANSNRTECLASEHNDNSIKISNELLTCNGITEAEQYYSKTVRKPLQWSI